jgi:hypothetical protein
MKHQKSAVNLGTKIKMIRFKPGLGGKKASGLKTSILRIPEIVGGEKESETA